MATSAPPRIAVVGGGIAGTLCSFVLKCRGLHPVLLDRHHGGVGGRMRGAPFWRASDPKLLPVFSLLRQSGVIQEWKGRFGMLGQKSGFLAAHHVTQGLAATQQDEQPSSSGGGTDSGDFCRFVDHSSIPTYLGMPNMANICPEICRLASIDTISNATVTSATPVPDGGWSVAMTKTDKGSDEVVDFDALVVATHDPSLASGMVQSIVDAEGQATSNSQNSNIADDDASTNPEHVSVVIQRLSQLAENLQTVSDQGRLPIVSMRVTLPPGISQEIPFDAVSVPGSQSIQFFARESPTSQNDDNAVWTVISTSRLAQQDILITEQQLSDIIIKELQNLLQPYTTNDNQQIPGSIDPIWMRRWGAAFWKQSMHAKEDSIVLAPWRFAICGDFVRELATHATPMEAAALSGLEAGERIATLLGAVPEQTGPARQ